MFCTLCLLLVCYFVEYSRGIECRVQTLADVNANCTFIIGDIMINQSTTETFAQLCDKFQNVEIINGRLHLIETVYNNFSFLSSLQTIYYTPIRNQRSNYYPHVLRVEYNHQLVDLVMPNLTTLSIDALPIDNRYFATAFVDNPRLCIPVQQVETWLLNKRVYVPQMTYCGIKIIEENAYYKKFTVENSEKIYCSMSTFNSLMPLGCQVLDKGIWFKEDMNITHADHFSKAIATVEYMMGPIIIRQTCMKDLNFTNLKTIYNMWYDGTERTGWGYQIMQFQDNPYLASINFPKLEKINHFGFDPYIKISDNPMLKCSPENCEQWLRLYAFQLDSCSCGLVPNFNEGSTFWSLGVTILEALTCATLTLIIYGNVMMNVYKSGFSYHDGRGYPWFVGVQFLLISTKDTYFYQAVNIVYTNRISLLLSCCLYRTISFVSFDHGKLAMGISFIIFIVSNVWSFNVLLSSGSKYAYGLYLINWIAFVVSIVTAIFLYFYLRKNFDTYSELLKHQKKLSIAFFLQALLSFVFCGFPNSVISDYEDVYTISLFLRQKIVFEYYYASVIIRWHYMVYGILIRFFLDEMLAKVDIRSDAVVTTRRSKATITPARQAPAAE